MDYKILVSFLTHRCQCPHVIKKGEELEAELPTSTRETCLQSPMLKKDTSWATITSTTLLDELKLFFIDKEKNLAMLDKYPRVKNLFLEFNTALPSSASVERLFSAGPLVLTARRNRLADAIFETLLMLKVNLNPLN